MCWISAMLLLCNFTQKCSVFKKQRFSVISKSSTWAPSTVAVWTDTQNVSENHTNRKGTADWPEEQSDAELSLALNFLKQLQQWGQNLTGRWTTREFLIPLTVWRDVHIQPASLQLSVVPAGLHQQAVTPAETDAQDFENSWTTCSSQGAWRDDPAVMH